MAALLLALVGCAAPVIGPQSAGQGVLVVKLSGFRNDQGQALISVYAAPRGFPDRVELALRTSNVTIRQGLAEARFTDLPYGEYAVSVLHDENGDGRMAAGWLGQPQEGFAFSGRPDYRFGRPEFADAVILVGTPRRELNIRMRYETARREHQEQNRGQAVKRPNE